MKQIVIFLLLLNYINCDDENSSVVDDKCDWDFGAVYFESLPWIDDDDSWMIQNDFNSNFDFPWVGCCD